MAGPDTKLSVQTVTTDSTGGYLYVIIPDGGGGWLSRRIDPLNLPGAAGLFAVDKEVSQSASTTFAMDASSKLFDVDFAWVSGTPLIRIGTTLTGVELSLAELSVPNNSFLAVNINTIFKITTTIYITITGGTVNFNVRYIENWF